ncbi:MAG: nucleotidyltransferase [Bathelium mastoideum]|nr:MAG: nucleotidyltransferase [Bathelium mastoideum]
MPPHPCAHCHTNRALILRPKNHQRLCKPCFLAAFEAEIHTTITRSALFAPGERVAIGASGGKDSTVLASVLQTLNARHGYGLELLLLAIDEGIRGYRDDALATVRRNAERDGLPLMVLGYHELYGWTMDEVVAQVGKKGNCTYCGVFRRQALDRGAARLGVRHVVTGHNADDVAETVLMNLLRGDLPRLARSTSIVTSTPSSTSTSEITNIKRSKPLKYAYEKEIVLYAHHKKLEYFSTECIYSPEAFRGSARTLIKNLERIRPSSILDIVKSGEDMAKLVPGAEDSRCNGHCGDRGQVTDDAVDDAAKTGCGREEGQGGDEEMRSMERRLEQNEKAEREGSEIEVTSKTPRLGQNHNRNGDASSDSRVDNTESVKTEIPGHQTQGKTVPNSALNGKPKAKSFAITPRKIPQQKMGQCERCGYLSSQPVCKACVLLEGLNKNRPKTTISTEADEEEGGAERMQKGFDDLLVADG